MNIENIKLEIKQEISTREIMRDKAITSINKEGIFNECNGRILALKWVLELFKRYEDE